MINPSEIDVAVLPSLPLSERSSLPSTPGIYFAIDSLGQIQYIGKSVNIRQRWIGHHQLEGLDIIGGIKISWLVVEDPKLLYHIETALINYFRPPLNQTQLHLTGWKPGMLALRIRSGKRAEEVAAELGVAMSTVRNWEQLRNVPRMTPMNLQKLMEVYQCSFEELVEAERLASAR